MPSIDYTISGSFIVPAGVNNLQVECWAAGGGGSTNGSSFSKAGGGGGGGAYAKVLRLRVVPNKEYTITIGLGGAEETDGGDTFFTGEDTIQCFAAGGKGPKTRIGGAGGALVDSKGDVKFAGGDGGAATDSVFDGGAGGGGEGADTTQAGNNGSANSGGTGGHGGAGTGGGDGGNGGDRTGDGHDAIGIGGGGGGAGSADDIAGVGFDGKMTITWIVNMTRSWGGGAAYSSPMGY